MADLTSALAGTPPQTQAVWVQEEPENMGAWRFLRVHWGESVLGHPLTGVSRPESASPATGSASSHKIEQQQILDAAFS